MFHKRPTINETEDDLLKQQEKFFNKGNTTKYKRDIQQEKSDSKTNNFKDNHDVVDLQFKIIERDLISGPLEPNIQPPDEKSNGFPQATKVTLDTSNGKHQRGLSLYAQKCIKDKTKLNNQEMNKHVNSDDLVTGIGLGIENWQQDMAEIKRENQKLIDGMSRLEIEKLREDIMKKLSPKTVEFLKSKRFPIRSEQKVETTPKCQKTPLVNENINQENIEEKIPIKMEDIKVNKYVNMNVIEKEKLNWMGNITDETNKNLKNSQDIAARFDFQGQLIESDLVDKIDVHQGLHHHGDEPSRPGYTINELFIYLQSSFPSQKQIGLKVFEMIISRAHQGYYDSCFNIDLAEYLIRDSPLVLIVRKCLDETSDTVWKSAINTMRALLFNTLVDEIFLDRGIIIFEDFLSYGYQIDLNLKPIIDKELMEGEGDEHVSDQQYLMCDVVECLLNRTSILQRFAYLIKNKLSQSNSDSPFIEAILDILIRLSRHSKESAECIIDSVDLMDAILPLMISRNDPINRINMVHVKIFKLFRVCITSIQKPKEKLSSSLNRFFNNLLDYSIIDSLNFSFLLVPEDASRPNRIILLVSIEALRLWLKLLTFSFQRINHKFIKSLEHNFYEIVPYLLKVLNYCKKLKPCGISDLSKTTFDFQFASCVLMLIKMYHEILNCPDDYAPVYSFDIYDIAMQWFSIINTESLIPHFDCNISILVLVEFILKHMNILNTDNQFLNLTLEKLMGNNQRFIEKLRDLCMKTSNTNLLKNASRGKIRDSNNLPSYRSIYFKGFQIVPVFNHDSCICLLQSLIRIAWKADIQISGNTLDHLIKYIDLVANNIKEANSSSLSIFDLIEINIVAQACLMVRKATIQNEENFSRYSRSIMDFALMIHLLNENQTKNEIIEKCLFDFQSEGLRKLMREAYQKYSRFDHVYWIFDPIISQVDIKNKKNKDENIETSQKDENKINLEELISTLKFLEYLYDNYNDHLLKININNNIMFEVLSTIFLIDEDLFFEEKICKILERFLKKLMANNVPIKCLVSDNIPKLGNMCDVFNQFANQFVNSSYYNKIFCNYLFVYFQTKCSPYFRNHFLSEYSECSVKMVHFKIDDLLMQMDNLLEPVETDLETLEVYLKTLLSENFNSSSLDSVLYYILIHHLNNALFNSNKNPIEEKEKDKFQKFQKLIRSVEMSKNNQLKEHLKNGIPFPKCQES